MEEKKKRFYKKGWFWIIVVLVILLVLESIIVLKSFNTEEISNTTDNEETNTSISSEELCELSKKINGVLESSSVYYSGDGSLIFIEIRNWDNEDNETKLKELFEILQSDYCKEKFYLATITTYMGEDNHLVMRSIYDIKNQENIDETEEYIDFDDYQAAMDSYTELYNLVFGE